MTDVLKPVVRLQASSRVKSPVKKVAVEPSSTIKLAVRLNEGINDALRTRIRYRGDLSKMSLQALETVDVARIALVSPDEPMVADTTISMPRTLHRRLKKIAEERRTSMNIVVNTALAHWLAGKGALRLAE